MTKIFIASGLLVMIILSSLTVPLYLAWKHFLGRRRYSKYMGISSQSTQLQDGICTHHNPHARALHIVWILPTFWSCLYKNDHNIKTVKVCEKKDEDEEDEEDDPNDLSKLTVLVLKAELKARDLMMSVNKPDREIEQSHQNCWRLRGGEKSRSY